MSEITAFIVERYGQLGDEGQLMIDFLERLWQVHRDLADPNFVTDFCSRDEDRFIERFWEMFLTSDLVGKGLAIRSSPNGPDIEASLEEGTIWVEAVVAGIGEGDNRLPDGFVDPISNEDGVSVYPVPYEQIMLRWTTSISAKIQRFEEYRREGIVGLRDSCVIAVNACRLGYGSFDGVSQLPAALEAVYPIGPQQIHIDTSTMEATRTTIAYRPTITNANDSAVPTDIFLDPGFTNISGVLAASKNADQALLGNGDDLIYVHNVNADNPVPRGFFQVAQEFWLEELEEGTYQIRSSAEVQGARGRGPD